ncbi:MAG: hypothetical protein HQ568_11295 [Calditrichaeota bacterium]|nr:hypothetical protein [Calditrichota bacterium]
MNKYLQIISILICLFISLHTSNAWAVLGEVLIDDNDDAELCIALSKNLTAVVNALETADLSNQKASFTLEGYNLACDLLKKVPMSNARRTHKTKLLKLPQGGYEVRDIKVKVEMGDTPGNPNQNLVFELTEEGLISDVRFAIETTHYKRLLEEGERLNDFARRQQILQTVEIFRTAYNRKDIDYLKRVYSDDALIIVGKVLKPRTDLPDMLENSGLSRDKIEFIKLSKAEYITNLSRCFEKNAFVKVVFDSVEVTRHNEDPDLYGVTVKQNWYSSTYSDTGWVFLLWDFQDENSPTIYVRSWQPERFEDGSVINLYEFKIVRSN